MDIIFQLCLILVPSGAVLMTAIFFMRKFNEREIHSIKLELKKERQKLFLPNQIEAYQRAVLLMERINPNSLLMRHNNPKKKASEMQLILLESIRNEYEHNMAQQIFISKESWDIIKKAKDETIRIINLAGEKTKKDAKSIELSSNIFEIIKELEALPTEVAVNILKKEIQTLF
ncbi:MAG: hypothetical protein CL844_02810 [Crocinitomicaceae bacterium]|nr:hypothetical protein [Crocinitomicaceae bacterium]|tara:strand:- start:6915 stop:7436 length:522 start_codon:yes stop_codon:yes gene_type:complete